MKKMQLKLTEILGKSIKLQIQIFSAVLRSPVLYVLHRKQSTTRKQQTVSQ